ncbi:hypothetical protein [Flavihumibacter solisilvae]|uniref:Uncharacterized protein n=1 Tax=Flavihumibacter solisilvae TaxID=1349421 RepID=A0A0C1IQ26_9BACT|nr:hypothetical protein [Flavihumibacter solisilvae]KIC96330.1 hypothetical protein OI18_00800 [Flavihumibacter solisilvae]
MNSVIHTHDDLQHEKNRLEGLLKIQKEQLKTDFGLLKKQLEPASAILRTVGMFTGSRNADGKSNSKPGLLKLGLDLGIDLLLRGTIFNKAGFVTRMAMPVLLRNFSSNVASGKGKGLFQSIKNIFSRKKN